MIFFVMILRPPIFTRTYHLLPYTTLFRSPPMTVVLRRKVRNVTAAADSDQRVDRFRKRDVAPGEAVCVMRDQQYLHPVPHIRPFGMVVRLFSKHRSEEHTSELQSLMRL